MFYLIFGVLWTVISLFTIIPFYNPNSATEIEVNGVIVSQEEFSQMLLPKLLFGFVLLIGIVVFLAGLYIVIRDLRTSRHGKKTIAVLVNVEPNGQIINDQKALDAVMLVLEENGECNLYRENIGLNGYDYIPGEFYEVLHYKNDINILDHIDENLVPSDKMNVIKNASFTNPEVPTFFEPTEVVIDNLKDEKNLNK